jgi:hypothetical protein
VGWLQAAASKFGRSNASHYARRIARLSSDDEVELINRILNGGYDQGCFLRPEPSCFLALDPHAFEEVFDALRDRVGSVAPTEPDPVGDEGIPAGLIDGREPGWAVITQRCDLVRCLRDEPFVELARATHETDASVVERARKNSSRLVFLASSPDGAWVVDLRYRALLAKDQLPATPALNPVPVGTDRRRLKLRIGQRYSRDALPDDLVETVQRPIIKTLRKTGARAASELFTEWLVFRVGGKVAIQALFDADKTSQANADDAYNEIEKALGKELHEIIAEDESGAVSLQNISLWRYFYGFKVDLDEVSYGSKASPGAAKPTL